MPGTAARKFIWALAAAAAILLLVVVTLPFVASTQIVRDGIARQMSEWSGYRVTLGGSPQIQVWPNFRAVLTDVALSSPTAANAPPVIEAERMEIDLSAFAALEGKVVFTKVRLVRPLIRLAQAGWHLLPASASDGKLAHAVEEARRLIAGNPTAPDASALPADPLSAIELQDGRIVRMGDGEPKEILSGLAATLDWPALNRPAMLTATGIWHGETTTINVSSQQPLFLLAGGAAPMSLSYKAAPLEMSFQGRASVAGKIFADGQLKLSSPSLKRALEWAGGKPVPGMGAGAISIACKVSGNQDRMKFENAKLDLDGRPGEGVFDLALSQTPPALSGTFAFDSLDLKSFVSAFTHLPFQNAPATQTPSSPAHPAPFDIDLRVSAASAAVGSIPLVNVAASAQVKNGLTAFDVSDAEALGGSVQFGLRIDNKAAGHQVELRFVGDGIDGAEVGKRLGWQTLMPKADGTVSVILKGMGEHWPDILASADGSISANFGKGTVSGVDLDAFVERSAEGGFFPLSDIKTSELTLNAAEVKMTVTDGVAAIDKAEATTDKRKVTLAGLMPLTGLLPGAGRGLALSGTVAPLATEGATSSDVPSTDFFVGGSWNAPYISPILPGPR